MRTRETIARAAAINGWAYRRLTAHEAALYTDSYTRDGQTVYLRYTRRGAIASAELREGAVHHASAWMSGKREQVLEWLNAEREVTA